MFEKILVKCLWEICVRAYAVAISGLSKEGWHITKYLCTELLIIFFGFFTFVPAIQVGMFSISCSGKKGCIQYIVSECSWTQDDFFLIFVTKLMVSVVIKGILYQ